MRQALKNFFAKEITLPDNSVFHYTIAPYELKNALGNVVAVLHEYEFSNDDFSESDSLKLYRTKEGTWYDLSETNTLEKPLHRLLKTAITQKEPEILTPGIPDNE